MSDYIKGLVKSVKNIDLTEFDQLGKIQEGQKIGVDKDKRLYFLMGTSDSAVGKLSQSVSRISGAMIWGTGTSSDTLKHVGEIIKKTGQNLVNIEKQFEKLDQAKGEDLIQLKHLEEELRAKNRAFEAAKSGLEYLKKTYQAEGREEYLEDLDSKVKSMGDLAVSTSSLLNRVGKKVDEFKGRWEHRETTTEVLTSEETKPADALTEEKKQKQLDISKEILDIQKSFTVALSSSVDRLKKMVELQKKENVFQQLIRHYQEASKLSESISQKLAAQIPQDPESTVPINLETLAQLFQIEDMTKLAFELAEIAASYENLRKEDDDFRKSPEQKAFSAYLKRNSVERYIDNQSRFIVAIQQLPRYEMLLGSLLKTTTPHSPEYNQIVKAQILMKSLAKMVNNRLIRHEIS